jgi:hypothetical protein
MMRRDDWQERLYEAFETARGLPFAYGTHDCALFCAYCVDRMTDSNIAQQMHETYNYADEDSAYAVINAAGSLEALATGYLGDPSPPLLCQRGDVMIYQIGDNPVGLGMHDGHQIIAPVVGERSGLIGVPLSFAIKGWRV